MTKDEYLENNPIKICPVCKSLLVDEDMKVYCRNCDFKINKKVLDVTLTPKDINNLLTSGKTRIIRFLADSDKIDAALKIEKGKVVMDFGKE